MVPSRRFAVGLGALAGLGLLAACNHAPTGLRSDRIASPTFQRGGNAAHVSNASDPLPSGERHHGNLSVEPAYDYVTGDVVYMQASGTGPKLTPANGHAVDSLYIVEYPAGSSVGTLDCEGVLGNCPDHDSLFAAVAQGYESGVYGTGDLSAAELDAHVVGHDHLVAGHDGHGSYDVARDVHEILFTNAGAADNHLTTWSSVQAALNDGDAIDLDLGVVIHLSVVSRSVYEHSTPVSG